MKSHNIGRRFGVRGLKSSFWLLLTLLLVGSWMWTVPAALAEELTLQSIDFATLPGDSLQFRLSLSGPPSAPRVFHTDNPARIALDLPGVKNGLDKKTIPVKVGVADSVNAVEASGRTRIVINLASMMAYTSRVEGNSIVLLLENNAERPVVTAGEPAPAKARVSVAPTAEREAPRESSFADGVYRQQIRNIDFRRGEHGEGRVIVTLGDPNTLVDVREEGRRVLAYFTNTQLPRELAKRLDVTDFATPVQAVEASMDGQRTRLAITPVSTEYDYSSYQSENVLTLEFRPLTKAEKDEAKRKEFAFTGQKLSLNFQDIPVRSVLQILADFTNLNIVAADSVQGNVTLRLNDVPWDQAMDMVLKSKGLGKRQEGNVVRVAPLVEINELERKELEAKKVVEELEPLRTELIQINYTKAEDIKTVLVGTTERTSSTSQSTNAAGQSTAQSSSAVLDSQSILSARGNVTTDSRTNTLIVKDTPTNIERIRELIRQIDKPVRQVLIESRIVIANNDFTRELGVRFGASKEFNTRSTNQSTSVRGSSSVAPTLPNVGNVPAGTPRNLLVDLPAAIGPGAGGGLGFALFKAGDYLLDLELSALQREGRGEIVSNPRLVTSDQTKASIVQGVELPFQVQSVAGGVTVNTITFKQAVLELNVTPHITPDDNIVMELLIRKDSRGELTQAGFGIDKRQIQTTAQVENGETVVLGGVYEGTSTVGIAKVPFFGDLPGVGGLFKKSTRQNDKRELLIFITPKILKDALASQ